jgi:sedoheptulokinase
MAVTLGIDIGTTKAAAVIYDWEKKQILDCASENTNADITSDTVHSEQDVETIFASVNNLMHSLGKNEKKRIEAIGLTGQMHGIVMWNEKNCSPLITWKDKRASTSDLLRKINKVPGAENLKDGWGITTLACLAQDRRLANWQHSSTIHDYFVYRMCGLPKAVTDPGDAASWGCFDIISNKWNFNTIRKLEIPESILPTVSMDNQPAGKLLQKFAAEWGVPATVPVAVAIGDNQASILSTSQVPDDEIYLTIGTGAQLTVILGKDKLKDTVNNQKMEIRPYFDGKYIAVAAPLCGGQAFAWLIDAVETWQQELGFPEIPRDQLFRKLDALGSRNLDTELIIKPNFLGERYNPDLTGIIQNINLNNFTLGNISAALAKGIVANLKQMMPEELLTGKKLVVGSGNAVRRLQVIQRMIEKVFDLPLKACNSKEEAACGAAIQSLTHL